MARLVSRDCVIDIELRNEIVTIGRSNTNAICLRAPGISKVHAKIEPCDEGFRICDLDSTNGTLVNGDPVKETVLRDHDFVKLGSEVLVYLADGQDASASQVLDIFESAERPAQEKKGAADDEFLWGADEVPAERREERAAVAVEEAPPTGKEAEHPEAEKEEDEVEMGIAEGEFALVGDLQLVEDFRVESYRLEKQLRARRFFVAVMWVSASVLLHLQVLMILGKIPFLTAAQTPQRIAVVNARFSDALEHEPLPPPPPPGPEIPQPPPGGPFVPPGEAAAEKVAAAMKEVTPIPGPDLKTIEVESMLAPPRPTGVAVAPMVVAANPGAGKILALVTPEKPQTQEEILDDLVREMVETLHKEFLHVILVFDESRSIDKDREWMRNRLDTVLKELYLHLKPRELPGLKWSVSSFGKTPHLQQTPTDKVEDIRKAIGRVPNDDSGIENPLTSLQFCMRNLRTAFATPHFSTFVILVTDERGDDTANDRNLEETTDALKKRRTRVFVFGREANFSTGAVKLPYRDPKSGETIQADTDVGPESAMPEFFTPDELFFRSEIMRSGYGMYALARIAAESKGHYYFLNPGPDVYDPVRLEQYTPDLCSRQEYVERAARVTARQKIMAIVREWDKVRPEQRVQTANVMTMIPFYTNKVDKAMAFCTEGMTTLKGLQFKKNLEPHNIRWEAHRDLVLAELYKFKFMLEEYKAGFKGLRGAPLSVNGGPLNGFMARLNPAAGGGTTPASRKLYESTLAQFKLDMEKHDTTPWAAIAANELKTMGPITIVPTYMPPAEERKEEKERKPRQPPPEPPKV